MTKFHIKTTSSSYLREKDVFLSDLRHFHEVRGSAIKHIPIINGKEVDLYHLYLVVCHHGGWVKVNNQGLWDSLLKTLGLPAACVNGGVGIRQIYLRYLERWERAKGGGNAGGGGGGGAGDLDGGGDDGDDDRPRRAAWGTPRPRNTVPLTYNHNQHNLSDHMRETIGLSPLQKFGGSSERLALSLLSPLPNEQDFALNVCTILAADVNNKLPVNTTPHIIDFLLGHAAVYNHPSLRDVIGKSYKDARKISMELYWSEHANPTGTLELLDERRFPVHGIAMRAIMSHLQLNTCLVSGELPIDDKDFPIPEELSLVLDEDDDIMGKKCHGGARDVISRRITQVATIMRNLSFHEDNLTMLAKHQTYKRFILLCANSSQSNVRQMGLDSLGNIAQDLNIKDPATCLLSRHLLSTLTTSLYSEDRARLVASLEVLNKLSQNEHNEDILLRCLEHKIYEQVCSYLTLHDIMLLVVTLECVYSLTSLGEKACDYIVKVHGVIDTLVSLITVEAQSYGPKACILMRVVETVPGSVPTSTTHAPSPPPVHQVNQSTVNQSQPTMHQLQTNHQMSAPIQTPNMLQTVQPLVVSQSSQTQQAKLESPQPVTQVANPTQMSIQQQHAHQQAIQENEQFALAWLRSTWEPCAPNIRLDSAELYKQYISCCHKVGRKGVISPLHFPRCVRSVFGGMVGPNPVKTVSGDTQQCYLGIKMRPSALNKPQPITPIVKQGPSSPILKAQLSKAEQSKLATHPHLTQVLNETPSSPPPVLQANVTQQTTPTPAVGNQNNQGNPSNTSLIKHLLAHKVSGAPGNAPERMAVQVTQRQAQNQQRMMGQTTTTNVNTQPNVVPMEVDAEALISCSTITAAGVTSTSPLPIVNPKTSVIPTLTPITTKNVTMVKQEELSEGVVIESSMKDTTPEESTNTSNSNKMLTDLLEKRSSPPMLVNVGQRVEDRKLSREDSDEPLAKIVKTEAVSSKAANLYAAFAADALEDEEDLLLEANNGNQLVQMVQQPAQVLSQPSQGIQGAQIIQQTNQQVQGQIIQQTNQQVQGQIVQQGGSIIQSTGQVIQPGNSIIQQSGQILQQSGQMVQQSVTAQNNQVIQQTGQIVHQANQVIQQTGQVVQQTGQIVQQTGQMVQQSGQLIQTGQIVQQTGQIVQQSGQIVQTGQIVQQSGQIVQQGGQIIQGQVIQQGGQIIQQGGQVVQQIVQQGQVVQQQTEGQIMVPTITNQSGQLILHGTPSKGNVTGAHLISHSTPVQFIAASNSQGLGFMQSVPHKTIIILQSGNGPNSPITLTVNNSGGLDENTLNSLISQATEAISMQQKQAQSGNSVIQNTGQIIQTSGGVIQATPTLIQNTSGIIQQAGIIKQQLIQGQTQLVPSQQPIITHQPQPQLISSGQIITTQGHQISGNQQVLVQSSNANQQIGQIITGNQQIVVGNQQIVVGNQQLVQSINVNSGQQQTRVIQSTGNQFIVDQHGNRQNVVNLNQALKQQQDKKILAANAAQLIQGQKIMVQNQNLQPNKTVVQPAVEVKPQPKKIPDEPWVCQWRGCDTAFESAAAVYSHACAVHCNRPELPCLWAHCDMLLRKKFSLMTHLQDRHCSTEALKAAHIQRRKGITPPPVAPSSPNLASSLPSPPPCTDVIEIDSQNNPNQPGYATNAALHAIKRHAVDFLNPRELMDDNEGPVTKSIRLTAALILRNIVIYSHTGRRLLRGYEPHLAGIALSTVEASRTVAQVLYDMNC